MEYDLTQQSYQAFASFLQQKLGIVLGDNRQYLVKSRLSALARDHNVSDINAFLKDVVAIKDRALTDKCLELMTTNETFWFRDQHPFDLLHQHVLPLYQGSKNKLRIWSSACASGQEPYSIAITVKEFKQQYPQAFSQGVEIIATDYSSKMVAHASKGIYDELALSRGLSQQLRRRYFTAVNDKSMQVNDTVKNMVSFQRLNLLGDYSSLGTFDIVFCRNVLIYFNRDEKTKILKKIAASLHNSGTLFLGAAESISGAESLFKMQSVAKGLYYTKP
ncbi:MAG: protein-glutamate O-methyltransferase CheR [Glaciecola sp.]